MVVWRCDNSAIKISLSTTGESFSLFLLDLQRAVLSHVKPYEAYLTIDVKEKA